MYNTAYDDYFPAELKEVFSEIDKGLLGAPGDFKPLLDSIKNCNDYYLIGADFTSYKEAQDKADRFFPVRTEWNKMTIHAALSMAKFSTDRTVTEYAEKIW